MQREAQNLNCADYAHATNPAKSYNSTLYSNVFGCTIVGLALPLLILGVIIAGIMIVMYGQKQEPQYPQYGGGY